MAPVYPDIYDSYSDFLSSPLTSIDRGSLPGNAIYIYTILLLHYKAFSIGIIKMQQTGLLFNKATP
jgi:hypothetical protein